MNAGIYRLVFNRSRGLLMVAGELAKGAIKSSVKSAVDTVAVGIKKVGLIATVKPLTFAYWLASGWVFSPQSIADIETDTGITGHQQQRVVNTANGIPQVNIRTPNQQGLSHNFYTQFDVDKKGAILNNSRNNVRTQQAGMVTGNPNLVGGTAKVILNEVNSVDRSHLNGFVEVAGDRADVIVANPNGITCSGCGFINAQEATVTTGRPQIVNGNLESFRVTQGHIAIEGDGLNSSGSDYTNIIARSVAVNADIQANHLRVTTGSNEVSADHQQITPIEGEGDKPQIAIDVAELGGMYAGHIHLVGTEAGVGVRNAGEIGAGVGEFTLTAEGRLENTGQMLAERNSDIHADKINNSGAIHSERDLQIASNSTIDNSGIINSYGLTRLDVDTVNNQGSGRIYGDQIMIEANTLNNQAESGQASVIAARENLQVGVSALTNEDGSLIYSGGDLTIGGEIANGQVTGSAEIMTNVSADLEAQGNILISATTLDNKNNAFDNENNPIATVTETIEATGINEYRGVGSSVRYLPSEVSFTGQDRATYLIAGGTRYIDWLRYSYSRTEEIERVIGSDPARIAAAGDITLAVQFLNNRQSHIIAAKALTAIEALESAGGTTNNIEAVEKHDINDNGTVTLASRGRFCAKRVFGKCIDRDYKTNYSTTAYNDSRPKDVPLSAIPPYSGNVKSASNSSITRSDIPLSSNNSLFQQNPSATASVLIETDPLFVDANQWLSSEYMLRQLANDPSVVHKRLGDGFYEQRLVREQLIELKGQLLLADYDNEQEQFQSLMDAGVRFAQAHNLAPGVTLSAEQMAALTSDIVWLETELFTLPDGSTQELLVPRVYALAKPGDVNGQGALIAGSTIHLSGDSLTNSGAITSNNSVVLNQGRIDDIGGRVHTDTIAASATEDINLTGSQWQAKDRLAINAQGKVTVQTETQTTDLQTGQRVSEGRDAQLTVTSETGELIVNADRDLTVSGANIINEGTGITALSAGQGLTVDTVVTRETFQIEGLTTNQQTHQGSQISGEGTVNLNAGTDLTLKAAHVNAGHDLQVQGKTISVTTAKNQSTLAYSVPGREIKQDAINHSGATLTAANNVDIAAVEELTLIGGEVNANKDIALNAGGNTTIAAAQDENYTYSYEKKKKSFGRSKTTIEENFNTTNVGGELNAGGNLTINAPIDNNGSVTANRDSGAVLVQGATLNAQEQVVIAGDDVAIVDQKEFSYSRNETRKSGFGGLSKSSKGRIHRQDILQAAQVRAEEQNLDLISASDINIIGSELISGGDINMQAVDDMVIAADQVLSATKEWSKKTSFLKSFESIYEREEDIQGSTQSTAVASSLESGGDINIESSRATIIGSDLAAKDSIRATTDVGDIEVLNASQSTNSYSKYTRVNVGLSDIVEQMLDIEGQVKNLFDPDEAQAKLAIARAEYDQVDSQIQSTDNRASSLVANNNIELNAAGDIAVRGSDVIADADVDGSGDVNLTAGGDVSITESVATTDTQTKATHGKGELSFVVQHQAVEVVKAARALEEAKDQLKQAEEDYRQYKKDLKNLKKEYTQLRDNYANSEPGILYDDIVELKDLIDEVESDKEWYQAGIALAATNLVSKTTLLAKQTAAAAASVATYGFNAGVQLDIEASKTDSQSHTEVSRGSTVMGSKINIQTGNAGNLDASRTQITGSHLQADNEININTGELAIEANRDNSSSNTDTKQGSIRIAQTVYGAAGGPTVSADFSRSRAKDSNTTFNNSTVYANTIRLNSTGDTTIKGANIDANDTLDVNVGGNLLVQSVQNKYSANSNSAGISAGFSLGAGASAAKNGKTIGGAVSNIGRSSGSVSSVSGGLNASNSRTRLTETVLTSLTGENVNINVGGHTGQVGSLIAAVDEEGNDNGNLTLKTQSYDYANLSNTAYSSGQSVGISTSIGLGGSSQRASQAEQSKTDEKGNPLRVNTSNVNFSNDLSFDKSKTLATLGNGNIVIGSDVETGENSTQGLNRNLNNTEKELYSHSQSQSVEATIDTRLLSETGREQIRRQIKELPANLEKVANDILGKVEQLTDSHQKISRADSEALQIQIREELAALSPEDRERVMQSIGIFMDGTGNDKYKGTTKGKETNVAILSDLYNDKEGDAALYYPGVGTNFLTAWICGFSGCGGQNRINLALDQIGEQWDGSSTISLDIFAFSRGSAQSLELKNRILDYGIPGVPDEKILINGLYLFDTVSSEGIPGNNIDLGYDLSTSPVVPVYHATAEHEYRNLFDLQSQKYADGTAPPNVTEQGFPGAHSNIGASYAPNEQGKFNTLSTIPLQWMHNNAVAEGAPLAPIPEQHQVPAELQNLYDEYRKGNSAAEEALKEHYIHDSRYIWERLLNDQSRTVFYPNAHDP